LRDFFVRSIIDKPSDPASENQHLVRKNSEVQGHSYKRHCSDSSSTSSADLLTNPKADFDQELQVTLEKYLKTHLLSSTKTTTENIQQQRKTRLSSLTKSDTEKLINQFHFPKQISNLKHYEKQVSHSGKYFNQKFLSV
jgi:hypothetical protein